MGYVYVVGEVEEPRGPVKIGTTSTGSTGGPAGLSRGNWRRLELLHSWALPEDVARWTEFVIHRNLRTHHRRGEWFDVRRLAKREGGWQPFLEAAAKGRLKDSEPWRLARGGHGASTVRRLSIHPRRFEVACKCGETIDGGEGRALATVLAAFAIEHVGLDPKSDLVRDITGWRMARPTSV
jgi:hypothetical protein